MRKAEIKEQENQDIFNAIEKKRPIEESDKESDPKKRKIDPEN